MKKHKFNKKVVCGSILMTCEKCNLAFIYHKIYKNNKIKFYDIFESKYYLQKYDVFVGTYYEKSKKYIHVYLNKTQITNCDERININNMDVALS